MYNLSSYQISNGSLVTAVQLKPTLTFSHGLYVVSYSEKSHLNKTCKFFKDLLPHTISKPYISVTPMSQVCTPATLLHLYKIF